MDVPTWSASSSVPVLTWGPGTGGKTGLEEGLGESGVTALHGLMEWGVLPLIPGIHRGAGLEEDLGKRGVTVLHGHMERGFPPPIPGIHCRTGLEGGAHGVEILAVGLARCPQPLGGGLDRVQRGPMACGLPDVGCEHGGDDCRRGSPSSRGGQRNPPSIRWESGDTRWYCP